MIENIDDFPLLRCIEKRKRKSDLPFVRPLVTNFLKHLDILKNKNIIQTENKKDLPCMTTCTLLPNDGEFMGIPVKEGSKTGQIILFDKPDAKTQSCTE